MAFTLAEKVDIRLYTGWSGRWHQVDSDLERAMSAIETEPEAETLIRGLLVSCRDIDAKMVDAHGRLKAMKVGSIDLTGGGELDELRGEGRRFSGRICSHLGVDFREDCWAGASPSNTGGSRGGYGGGNYALHG